MAPRPPMAVGCSQSNCMGVPHVVSVGQVRCDTCGTVSGFVELSTASTEAPTRNPFRVRYSSWFAVGLAVLFGFSSFFASSPSRVGDEFPRPSTGSLETLIECLRTQRASGDLELPACYGDVGRFADQCRPETAANDPLLNIWIALDARTKREVILLINDLNDWTWAYPLVGNILISGVEPDDWILCKLVESFFWIDPDLPEIRRIVGQTLIASGVSPIVQSKVVELLL